MPVRKGHHENCDYPKAMNAIKLALMEWPDHCQTCAGSGWIEYTENLAPHGAGTWLAPMSDVCDDCLWVGKCPRCGKEIWAESDVDPITPCPYCGWEDDSRPLYYDPYCSCWHYEERELPKVYKENAFLYDLEY